MAEIERPCDIADCPMSESWNLRCHGPCAAWEEYLKQLRQEDEKQ